MKRIKVKDIKVIVHEPILIEPDFFHSRVENNVAPFKREADLIVANRMSDDLADVSGKVFTRDLFRGDALMKIHFERVYLSVRICGHPRALFQMISERRPR